MHYFESVSKTAEMVEKFGFATAVAMVLLIAMLVSLHWLLKLLSNDIGELKTKLLVMDGRLDNQIATMLMLRNEINALRSDLREVLIEIMRGNPTYDAFVKFLTINQPSHPGDD